MSQHTTIGAPATGGPAPERADRPSAHTQVVPVKHVGRGVFATLVAIAVVVVIYGLAVNKNIDWSIVGQFVFNGGILGGLLVTIELTVVSMVVALILAFVIAVMRLSPSRIISGVSYVYVFVFRGIPLIVLVLLVGNLGLFFKTVTIGIPFTNVVLFSEATASLVTPFWAGVIGLSLAGSAYMAEIVRSGLMSIGKGQREAAKALGLNGGKTLRYIVLPQAMRVIVPPLGNELIGMLKSTAIVSVISSGDLLTVAQGISGANYRTIELLIVASIWYFAVIIVFSIGQHHLEKRIAER
jgi:polar amino acid transport system permease protein